MLKAVAISPLDNRYFACDNLIQNVREVTMMVSSARFEFYSLIVTIRRQGVKRASLFCWRQFLRAVKALKATYEANGRKLADLILKPSRRVRLEHHQ
jgi:hypothetical protein